MRSPDPDSVNPLAGEVTPPKTYWVIAWLLLVWGIGYAALVAEAFFLFTPDDFDRLVTAGTILPGYSDYVQQLPPWIVAISLFKAATRIGGALGLLLRKSWSITLYALSFAASCVIFFRGFLLEGIASVERPSQVGLEALFFALSIFALCYALRAAFRSMFR
ncbi:MAG: hypothetical protein AB8B57_09100 [Congregibacter sp.]